MLYLILEYFKQPRTGDCGAGYWCEYGAIREDPVEGTDGSGTPSLEII